MNGGGRCRARSRTSVSPVFPFGIERVIDE
jgi:hypothetical protein